MSVTFPEGFVANGVACGLKDDGRLDLSFVALTDRSLGAAAAVFTQNLAAAAPVRVSRSHLSESGGRACAVILSSGNANAATGEKGLKDALRMTELAGTSYGVSSEAVLVCSTGLIGIPLPIELIDGKAQDLVQGALSDEGHSTLAAQAIMTTDTFAKVYQEQGSSFRVGGMAKGAAMIAPNMATMLCVLTTDADFAPEFLQTALSQAVELTFNRISLDGCTSTNDSVILISSNKRSAEEEEFTAVLLRACRSLADQIVEDAEGSTKVVTVRVSGARDDVEALRGARKIAESELVKCSFYGADPYWGRLASELGTSQIAFDIDKLSVSYQGIAVAAGGVDALFDSGALSEAMAERHLFVECNLGLGVGEGEIRTCDLTPGYIAENMRTS